MADTLWLSAEQDPQILFRGLNSYLYYFGGSVQTGAQWPKLMNEKQRQPKTTKHKEQLLTHNPYIIPARHSVKDSELDETSYHLVVFCVSVSARRQSSVCRADRHGKHRASPVFQQEEKHNT